MGEFWENMGEFWENMGEFWENMGENMGNMGNMGEVGTLLLYDVDDSAIRLRTSRGTSQ